MCSSDLFTIGLAKKAILANGCASVADTLVPTCYYRRWGEINLFIIHAMSFGTRSAKWMKIVLDLLFFFCFGFVIPFVEAWMIFLN